MNATGFGMALIQIVWVNILLSGDNGMVIALACRSLPGRQRRIGIALGWPLRSRGRAQPASEPGDP